MQRIDSQFLASHSHILGSQHSSIRGRFIAIGLDFHTTSYTSDGFAATGITQNISLGTPFPYSLHVGRGVGRDEPEIGDMDEGVIEGSKDSGDTEDQFTYGLFVRRGGLIF